jgi:Flp pilus assembly protein TadG
MIRSILRGRDREDGQILVLFAGGLVALLLMVGLVIDGGTAFLNRRDAQNSADLSALSGVKRLADYYVNTVAFSSTNNVYTALQKSLSTNNCPASTDCTWTARYVGARSGASFADLGAVRASDTTPPIGTLGVKVDVQKTPRTFILGILGQSSWTVSTTATAIVAKPTGAPAGQLLPIGFKDGLNLVEGQVYALTSGMQAPGNFGFISWTGSNDAGALATAICTPNNPAFALPRFFPGDPGKTNASDVRACLQQWVDNTETVLIPIIDVVTGQGNNTQYRVTAIAAFQITGYSQPAVDQINGLFKGTYPYTGNASVPGGLTTPPSAGDKVYFIGLAQ